MVDEGPRARGVGPLRQDAEAREHGTVPELPLAEHRAELLDQGLLVEAGVPELELPAAEPLPPRSRYILLISLEVRPIASAAAMMAPVLVPNRP